MRRRHNDAHIVAYFLVLITETPGAGNLSQYITRHPGQLSLAIPTWVGAMRTRQTVVMLCGWEVKTGRLWFLCGRQVKLCDPIANRSHI